MLVGHIDPVLVQGDPSGHLPNRDFRSFTGILGNAPKGGGVQRSLTSTQDDVVQTLASAHSTSGLASL
jgi:hypothetical protein